MDIHELGDSPADMGEDAFQRLAFLVQGLPLNNALERAKNPDAGGWRAADFMLAGLLNATRQAHFKDPKLVQTPLDEARKRQEQRNRERKARAWLRRFRNGR